MQFDLSTTPFSKFGSYLSVSYLAEEGFLQLRHVRKLWGSGRLFQLTFRQQGEPVLPEIVATPWVITATAPGGRARIYLRGDDELVLVCEGMEALLTMNSPPHGIGFAEDDEQYFFVSGVGPFLRLTALSGALGDHKAFVMDGDNHKLSEQALTLTPAEGEALLHFEVMAVERHANPALALNPDSDIAELHAEWQRALAAMPAVPVARRTPAELAWYTLWSCVVRAEGNFAFDAMLMSKNFMTAVWSWDHCFNALAVAPAFPELAMGQWMLPFALQQENGVLPDLWQVDDAWWQAVKPPIHGWCLQRLLAQHDYPVETVATAYTYLEHWTNWWLNYRDSDHDGIPNYIEGVDSGWDNATIFDIGPAMETPDLPAFLVLQMHALADLARRLGQHADAASWQEKAAEMLERLYAHAWTPEGFVAKQSRTHAFDPNPTSLLSVMPLVLGEYLDAEKFTFLATRLEQDFLTPYGPATEMPGSAKYIADGYWRGPIWAPTTYLIVDGLRRGGRPDLASEVARRFCNMVAEAGGNYENYDALTGRGLRDQAYSWTAAVHILLLHKYLLPAEG